MFDIILTDKKYVDPIKKLYKDNWIKCGTYNEKNLYGMYSSKTICSRTKSIHINNHELRIAFLDKKGKEIYGYNYIDMFEFNKPIDPTYYQYNFIVNIRRIVSDYLDDQTYVELLDAMGEKDGSA